MHSLYRQYRFNVGAGPLHEAADALPSDAPASPPVALIAYYLPQFHPIAENDAWWGPGFTEWTNVTKALPRYLGHRQPRLPADLGFYDLRQADVLRRQADLARRAGIAGFCIHNYWFSGRRVLETPLRLLLEDPGIDLRFCLNWANENWSRRWDGSEQDLLLEQRYDPADELGYLESILPALRDPRYIRIDGRPLLMVYRPRLVPDMAGMSRRWRDYLIAQGVGDPYLVMAQSLVDMDPRPYGFDAAAGFPPNTIRWDQLDRLRALRMLDRDCAGYAASYADLAAQTLRDATDAYRLFPGVCPGWDNEPRRPGRGHGFFGSTPAAYGDWLKAAAAQAMAAPSADARIVFVNAWNEWAEGAILEPDRHFGHAYLAETRRVVDALSGAAPRRAAPRRAACGADGSAASPAVAAESDDQPAAPRPHDARAPSRTPVTHAPAPPAPDPFAVTSEAEGLTARSVRGSVVTALSQFVRLAIQIGSQVVLARLLFPADFGLLAMVYPIIGLIQTLSDLGLGQAIVQRPTLEQDRVSALFWVNLAVGAGLACLVVLASPVAAWLYGEPRVIALMCALALLMPIGALGIHPGALLSRQMKFGLIALNEIVGLIMSVVVTTALAWWGWSYWSLVAGQLASMIVGIGLGWSMCGWRPSRPRFVRAAWQDLRFGANVTGANLAIFVTTSADNVIIGVMNGRDPLGLYDRSYRLCVQPLTQMLAPLSRVAVPLLSRLVERPEQYRTAYLGMVRALLLSTVPAMLVCVVNADTLVHVFLGPRWQAAAPIFAWICVGGLGAGINSSAIWLYVSQGRTRDMRRYLTAASIINLASFLVGSLWGIVAVAGVAATLFVGITTPLVIFGASRDGPVRWREILLSVTPFILESVAVYALLAIERRHPMFTGLAELVLATLLSYGSFLALALIIPGERRSLIRLVTTVSTMAR